jgi:hypothetical protein
MPLPCISDQEAAAGHSVGMGTNRILAGEGERSDVGSSKGVGSADSCLCNICKNPVREEGWEGKGREGVNGSIITRERESERGRESGSKGVRESERERLRSKR